MEDAALEPFLFEVIERFGSQALLLAGEHLGLDHVAHRHLPAHFCEHDWCSGFVLSEPRVGLGLLFERRDPLVGAVKRADAPAGRKRHLSEDQRLSLPRLGLGALPAKKRKRASKQGGLHTQRCVVIAAVIVFGCLRIYRVHARAAPEAARKRALYEGPDCLVLPVLVYFIGEVKVSQHDREKQ